MKLDKTQEISRWIVIGICIVIYVFFIYNLLAAYLSLFGSQPANPLLT